MSLTYGFYVEYALDLQLACWYTLSKIVAVLSPVVPSLFQASVHETRDP